MRTPRWIRATSELCFEPQQPPISWHSGVIPFNSLWQIGPHIARQEMQLISCKFFSSSNYSDEFIMHLNLLCFSTNHVHRSLDTPSSSSSLLPLSVTYQVVSFHAALHNYHRFLQSSGPSCRQGTHFRPDVKESGRSSDRQQTLEAEQLTQREMENKWTFDVGWWWESAVTHSFALRCRLS